MDTFGSTQVDSDSGPACLLDASLVEGRSLWTALQPSFPRA